MKTETTKMLEQTMKDVIGDAMLEMKQQFIRFLKDEHAWDEFKKCVDENNSQLRKCFKVKNPVEDVLSRLEWGKAGVTRNILECGNSFFYDDVTTDVDWQKLSDKWKEQLKCTIS